MNKINLVEIVAASANIKKKDAETAVDAMFAAITEQLKKGEKVQIAGFGAFKLKERTERVGRNPKTHEAITIPASKTVNFTAGKALKDTVNG